MNCRNACNGNSDNEEEPNRLNSNYCLRSAIVSKRNEYERNDRHAAVVGAGVFASMQCPCRKEKFAGRHHHNRLRESRADVVRIRVDCRGAELTQPVDLPTENMAHAYVLEVHLKRCRVVPPSMFTGAAAHLVHLIVIAFGETRFSLALLTISESCRKFT